MQFVMDLLSASSWSPYAVGVGIGVLSWIAFLLSDNTLGVSSALAASAGIVEKTVRGPKVLKKQYYRENPPAIDWEWLLVFGLFVGALSSSWLSGDFRWEWVPPMWEEAFGSNIYTRLAVALFGGICIGFGARWGKGCTSGHGISGTLQLVVSSWLAVACFFIAGVIVAMLIYRW